MKSSPQLKTDYPTFENKHALQPIGPARTVKSSRFWRHLCLLYKNYRFHILHKRPGQENNKEKKNNLPDFKDCSPFPRFHLRQFRDQLIFLVTVALQLDGGD